MVQITKPGQVLEELRHKKRIVTAMAAAEPSHFFHYLSSEHKEELKDATIYCANPSREYDCFKGVQNYQIVVMFLTAAMSKHQGRGHVHYIPQHLSQWARNLRESGGVDIFWGSCSPPDARGFVSLGPSTCYESEVIRTARHVVLEINKDMPVTFGDTHIATKDVDFFVESKESIPTILRPAPSMEDTKIAGFIESLVPEGATLQLGIGKIPNAVGRALMGHKDLGIHTEMINDTMMDLAKEGVITGSKKTIWPGKIVGSFAYGSRELYDFIDKNPMVELQPASVVNDPYRIGRNFRMVSINTAVEVDITGQVCSESVGHRELSGIGGASETHIGAQRSEGGRGIIALRSLTKDGKSKIGLSLTLGAKVSISRNDIDTIVTEYGIAHLRGKSVKERTKAMIRIAHPDFRDTLEKEAFEARYL